MEKVNIKKLTHSGQRVRHWLFLKIVSITEHVHRHNLKTLGKHVFKILFPLFLAEKLRCFEVDSFIEKLIVKFVRANLTKLSFNF